MPEKLDIQFMGRFKCSFTHRQRESGLLILDSSPRRRVWLDYDEPDKRGERLSVLCVLKIAAVRRELAVELQNLDDGMVEIQPSTFTASIAKRRKQRLEFPSGLSGGAADRISQITADIDRIADNVIFNFRWRLGLHGAGRPTSTAGKYLWSKDGKHWSPVPRTTYGDLEFRRDLVVENLDADIVAIGLADERFRAHIACAVP